MGEKYLVLFEIGNRSVFAPEVVASGADARVGLRGQGAVDQDFMEGWAWLESAATDAGSGVRIFRVVVWCGEVIFHGASDAGMIGGEGP